MKVLGSIDTPSSAFDLSAASPTHSSSVSSTLAEFTPTSFLTGTGPVETVVPTTSGSYLHLAKSYFHVRAHVREADQMAISNIRNNDVIFLGYMFLHSFFNSVELRAQDKTWS